jgi:hypothetical protein
VTQTIEEKNKAFVLEAFDTLFNKRDYAAAERFSELHSAQCAHSTRAWQCFRQSQHTVPLPCVQ